MNLFEFLENLDPSECVIIKTGDKIIFDSKVSEISEEDAFMYWIPPESISLVDGKMHIPVEHQDEVNKRIEEHNRKKLGYFAEHIGDAENIIKKRISILEAIIWAQEHHNQVMYLSDNASDTTHFKNQLMAQYGFSDVQACSIIDMRNRSFTKEERKKIQEELQNLFDKEKLFL